MYDHLPKITEIADQILAYTKETNDPTALGKIVDVVLWKLRRQERQVEHDAIYEGVRSEMKYAREKVVAEKYRFAVYGTQGGGLVRCVGRVYIFVTKPDVPGLDVGDTMPHEWGTVPANDLARQELHL